MGKKVVPINRAWNDNFQEFITQVERGDITHGVICYRLQNGRIGYRTFNDEELDRLIGILERVKWELCNT